SNPNGGVEGINLTTVPDECPVCRQGMHPRSMVGVITSSPTQVQFTFQCTRASCRAIFIAYYGRDTGRRDQYFLERLGPLTHKADTFGSRIEKVSPNFTDIYNRAGKAEADGLGEIAGMGFRKALEFLVKDFAIHKNPSDADAIKRILLGRCIKQYVIDA